MPLQSFQVVGSCGLFSEAPEAGLLQHVHEPQEPRLIGKEDFPDEHEAE
jgi:hypothetical protein